jgi:hypothetical protein
VDAFAAAAIILSAVGGVFHRAFVYAGALALTIFLFSIFFNGWRSIPTALHSPISRRSNNAAGCQVCGRRTIGELGQRSW